MKCKVCGREAKAKGFCPLHLKAYLNVIEKFDVWAKALSISWSEYLCEVQKNSLTGEWAKEVINCLIQEEKQGVKKN